MPHTLPVWDISSGDAVLPRGAIIAAILPCPRESDPVGARLLYDVVDRIECGRDAVTYHTKRGWIVPCAMVYAFAVGAMPVPAIESTPYAESFTAPEPDEPPYVPDVYNPEDGAEAHGGLDPVTSDSREVIR